MIPLFKTHYSIGKSILTLESPDKVKNGGSDSAIKIAKDAGLTQFVLVEDNFHGFPEAKKRCEDNDLDLKFGIRLNVCNDHEYDETHKVVIFAKNDEGCKRLYRLYSAAFCEHEGKLTISDIKKYWDLKDLKMVIPFYDSFLHYNHFTFSNFSPNLHGLDPTFFIEDNGLPFDRFLANEIMEYVGPSNTKKVKTIYYKNESDFKQFQSFKIICGRITGRKRDLSSPGLDHFCSNKFSFESWINEK